MQVQWPLAPMAGALLINRNKYSMKKTLHIYASKT